MRQFSAALLTRALALVTSLFIPARGRHSAAVRRRSTRVRRYAPAPAPASARSSRPTTPQRGAPRPAPRPVPPPRLAPAPETFPADDIALVRPYYTARERECEHDLSRVQAEAVIRLRAWSHGSVHVPAQAPLPVPSPTRAPAPTPAPMPVPIGDLLAAAPARARYADGVTV
ncbi:hypothetical protein [Nocardiopsis sp. HUAS JQ3]|uniref:hypothetical protein n=1 Tax=Nocardiopsis sp. HUAS JQ3 TaxID=3061629 RepID=UPI0023A9D568|nr:hypothetical protein [Nocardiopsis sp. HUAS JQ3]WDZ90196.1 hypothetical protein PV789_25405 [Nocardiopsis sp. HUAS JQ3]